MRRDRECPDAKASVRAVVSAMKATRSGLAATPAKCCWKGESITP